MKLNLKYIIAVSALVGMAGCDDKIEPFEITGSTATPVAISASAVQSEALPGEIKLTWAAPQEDFAYMQIRYNDPLQKKIYANWYRRIRLNYWLRIHVPASVTIPSFFKLLMVPIKVVQ